MRRPDPHPPAGQPQFTDQKTEKRRLFLTADSLWSPQPVLRALLPRLALLLFRVYLLCAVAAPVCVVGTPSLLESLRLK